MPKKLNAVLNTSPGMSLKRPGSTMIVLNKRGYTPVGGDEKKFVHNVHPLKRHDNRQGNQDDIFQATNIKTFDRAANRMGYNSGGSAAKAEFVADRSKDKEEVSTEENLNEKAVKPKVLGKKQLKVTKTNPVTNTGRAPVKEEYEMIVETTQSKAHDMAQELADRFGGCHFVHSFKIYNKKTGRALKGDRYGVISKDHYDNGFDKSRYHLTHVVHPTPPKPIKMKKSSMVGMSVPYKEEEVVNEAKPAKALRDLLNARGSEWHITPSTKKADNTTNTKAGSRTNIDAYFKGLTVSTKQAQGCVDDKGSTSINPTFTRESPSTKKAYAVSNEEELDELSKKTLRSYVKKSKNDMADEAYKSGKNKEEFVGKKEINRKHGINRAVDRLTKEEDLAERKRFIYRSLKNKDLNQDKIDQNRRLFLNKDPKPKTSSNWYTKEQEFDEKLDHNNPAGNFVHHFVHSKNKRFAGKDNEERIRMGLGAFYAEKRRHGSVSK